MKNFHFHRVEVIDFDHEVEIEDEITAEDDRGRVFTVKCVEAGKGRAECARLNGK